MATSDGQIHTRARAFVVPMRQTIGPSSPRAYCHVSPFYRSLLRAMFIEEFTRAHARARAMVVERFAGVPASVFGAYAFMGNPLR